MSSKTNKEVKVCIARSEGQAGRNALLADCLAKAGLWDILNERQKATGKEAGDLYIAILPDMEHYRKGSVSGVDPSIVEELIDLLADRGYESISLAVGADPAAVFLENRDGWVLADLCGYQFETPGGTPYDLFDLASDTTPADFHPKSILHGKEIGIAWTGADVRLVFGKNKSHDARGFALCAELMTGVMPLRDEAIAAKKPEALVDLLRQYPPHFCMIDGWTSCHGSMGSLQALALETKLFIASPDLLLCDWTASLLMGLDPYLNPHNALPLRQIGLPPRYKFDGDISPIAAWRSPNIWQRQAAGNRAKDPIADQLARAWLLEVDTEIFPFRHILDARMNESLKPWLGKVNERVSAAYMLSGLNYMLGYLRESMERIRILYQKDKLVRQPGSLGFDPAEYSAADYDQVEHYIRPLEQIAANTPPDQNGLHWRYIDGSVLFQFSRVLEVPYDIFVEKVDIAAAVAYMYDNMGGKRVTVAEDKKGRITRQAERDIYLPQPNWLSLFGGKWIDVCKIETLSYEKDAQTIFWRTVCSPNDSARFDDGKVSFERHPGGTRVVIVARQEFSLPLFWQVFDLDHLPKIKEAIVSNAYVSFFNRTMANLEAVSEGRDPRLGRDPTKTDFAPQKHPLAIEYLEELISGLGMLLPSLNGDKKQTRELGTDVQGYRHFAPGHSGNAEHPLRQIARDLGAAIAKDLRIFPGQNNRQ